MSSKDIFTLRKEGRAGDALKMARTEFASSPNDVWLLRAYAWVIFDHVRKLTDAFEAKELSPSALSGQITPFMREFSKMANPLRRDMAFSQMLRLAAKVDDVWDNFLAFARWSGVDDFDEEGKAPFVTEEGKQVDSLQTQFKRAICRQTAALAATPHADQELLDWGRGIAAEALDQTPDDQWLNYYQSKIHLARGEESLALERLVPILRRQARAAWPWALLGKILESTRPVDAVTCYAHATQVARDEQEVVRTRVHLAQLLARSGRFHEAAWQVDKAARYREGRGFKASPDLASLMATDWYSRIISSNGQRELPLASSATNALLRELDRRPLTYTRGVIEHINLDRALSYVAITSTDGVPLHHDRFPEIAHHLLGTLVEIGQVGGTGPVTVWRVADAQSLPGFYEFRSGQLTRQESQAFAFVRAMPEDIFVPPDLARAFAPGQSTDVSCWAIRRADKKGRTGWRVVRFA